MREFHHTVIIALPEPRLELRPHLDCAGRLNHHCHLVVFVNTPVPTHPPRQISSDIRGLGVKDIDKSNAGLDCAFLPWLHFEIDDAPTHLRWGGLLLVQAK